MKEIIIKLEPFVFKQTLFIKDEQGTIVQVQVPQREVASYISFLAGIEKIHLFGNEKFINKIREECITKYNLKNIEFCMNR